MLVSVSNGFVDIFENWLYWYQLLALDMRVVLMAEDKEVYDKYVSNREFLTRAGRFEDIVTQGAHEYESPAYKNLVSNRPAYLLEIFQSYSKIIYTDIDTVWLEDPRPFFTGNYDMWISLDEEHIVPQRNAE